MEGDPSLSFLLCPYPSVGQFLLTWARRHHLNLVRHEHRKKLCIYYLVEPVFVLFDCPSITSCSYFLHLRLRINNFHGSLFLNVFIVSSRKNCKASWRISSSPCPLFLRVLGFIQPVHFSNGFQYFSKLWIKLLFGTVLFIFIELLVKPFKNVNPKMISWLCICVRGIL